MKKRIYELFVKFLLKNKMVEIGANETRKNELCRLNLTLNSADYKRVGEILVGAN